MQETLLHEGQSANVNECSVCAMRNRQGCNDTDMRKLIKRRGCQDQEGQAP